MPKTHLPNRLNYPLSSDHNAAAISHQLSGTQNQSSFATIRERAQGYVPELALVGYTGGGPKSENATKAHLQGRPADVSAMPSCTCHVRRGLLRSYRSYLKTDVHRDLRALACVPGAVEIMVNVKVVFVGVVFPPPPPEEDPPPQPETQNDPAIRNITNDTRNDHSKIRDRLLAFPNPNNEMNPQGMTQPKASFSSGVPGGA